MVAKLQPEFQKRNVKTIAISVDPVESHYGWVKDIEETQGAKVYSLIAPFVSPLGIDTRK